MIEDGENDKNDGKEQLCLTLLCLYYLTLIFIQAAVAYK